MVRLILGRAGAGKTTRIFHEIAAEVQAGRGGIVLLVPEQYSHEAERELCRVAGDALSLYGEVLSFTGLARKVFAQLGGARPVMDRGGRLLCMAVAAENVASGLKVYRGGRRDARLLDSMVRAAEELRSAGADTERLLAAAERLPGLLGDKLRDLALLTEAYAAAEGRSAADPADVMETLADIIGDSTAVSGRFYIDGFSDFTALEKRVLRELIRAGADLTVCLTCAGDAGSALFALAEGTARWLAGTARGYGQQLIEERMEPDDPDAPLSFFCERLFDFAPADAPEAGDAIRLVEATDVYEECELAAARMSELARAGVRWREMAVAVRGFGDYRAALESACARYGVPLFLSGRGDMLRKSVPMLISSALDAVGYGYEYEAVFGYLKTDLAPVRAADCDRLENYAILWGVRGAAWKRPFTMHPEGYNRVFDDGARALLGELDALRERVIAPLETLEAASREAATAAQHAQALADFLVSIRLPERLAERADELEAAGRAETAAEYERLWDIVCAALEQFAAVLGGMSMDAAGFRELFLLMLGKYDVGVIPVSLDRVQAGDLDGTRRRHVRHLLLLGAEDGRLPAPEDAGGVFTPEEREELTALGIALGGAEEELTRELFRIYSCLTLPSESIYISRPLTDGEGGQTRPSIVAERARALFGIVPVPGDVARARTFSREAAFALAVQGEAGQGGETAAAAREVFRRAGRAEELAALVRAAGKGRGELGPEAVSALYGEEPSLSATRAERFANCRFSYFLQYGLKAKPRQQAVFDPRDYGTFIHYVLEHVAREALELGGFAAVTREQLGKLTDKYVDLYIREQMNDFADKSPRFEYLFRRLRTTVRRVTEDMWQELRVSSFQPIDIELDLTAEGVLAPVGDGEVRVTGQADRVDGYVKDGVLYLRVTDYKTGRKKFDLSDVCEGIDMQMLLYLFTLSARGAEHFGAGTIRPAGVLYSPARFDVVRADADVTDEELADLRRTSAKRSGLILGDPDIVEAMEPGAEKRFLPVRILKSGAYSKDSEAHLATLEQFGALGRYINDTLRDMAAQLRAGSVAADPWFKSAQENACALCDYAKACMFDEERDCRRIRTRLTAAEAWERIEAGHE